MRGIGGRRDKNHGPIREGLRACGFTVEDNADAGNGKPDLIVGAYRVTFLLEVKAEKGKESPEQEAKRKAWKGGPWLVVRSLEEALREIWKHRDCRLTTPLVVPLTTGHVVDGRHSGVTEEGT